MPNYDKTGPFGQGKATGRGFGPCNGNQPRFGFGCRRGFGRGLGRYFGFNQPETKEEKLVDLKDYQQALTEELKEVEKQLTDLQSKN